jgi:hypothetical protein
MALLLSTEDFIERISNSVLDYIGKKGKNFKKTLKGKNYLIKKRELETPIQLSFIRRRR